MVVLNAQGKKGWWKGSCGQAPDVIVVQVEPEQLVERAEEPLGDLEDVVETDKERVQSGGQVGVLNGLQLGYLVSKNRTKNKFVKSLVGLFCHCHNCIAFCV